MDLLQIRDEINRLMKCNYPYSSEIDAARAYLPDIITEFEIKLKENKDSKLLINIVEGNKENYLIPIDVMFLVFQRLIELQPNKNHLLDFSIYLWNVGGPDWKEELEAIEKLVKEDKIHEAVEIALKVDYYKYQVHEFK